MFITQKDKKILMFKNKSAAIPVLKTIVILTISVLIFLSFILILLKTTDITIGDKELQADIVTTKFFNSNCFGKDYGIIEKDLFTSENIEKCFINLPKNIGFCVSINAQGLNAHCVNKDFFEARKNYCSVSSNIYCNEILYPIILQTDNGLEQKILKLQVISN